MTFPEHSTFPLPLQRKKTDSILKGSNLISNGKALNKKFIKKSDATHSIKTRKYFIISLPFSLHCPEVKIKGKNSHFCIKKTFNCLSRTGWKFKVSWLNPLLSASLEISPETQFKVSPTSFQTKSCDKLGA